MKKLIEREYIQYILDELFLIQFCDPKAAKDKTKALIEFIEENIVQQDKENLNEIKRTYYKRMKEAKTEEENKFWYERYQKIKNFGILGL